MLDWRRRISALYAAVRTAPNPADGHASWIRERDTLFARHPASPIPPEEQAQFTGLRYAPYDPALRFEVRVDPDVTPLRIDVTTGTDGVVPFDRIGRVRLPIGDLDVWWLGSYGGGLFLPLRDGSSGRRSYGGGRYLLDTVKGADLGGDPRRGLVVDLNFAYNPSCAYDPAWACPLAPPGNRLDVDVHAGELASASTGASAGEFLPDEEKTTPD